MIADAREIPEIVAAIEAFIADPEPYKVFCDPPLDVRSLCAEVRILPAMLDWGGCLGIRPSGEVVSFSWDDDPRVIRVESDPRIRNMAYYRAGLKHPLLVPLMPRRSANAVVCSTCNGTGQCQGLPERIARSVVCYCGGLGWLPGESTPSRT